MPSGAHNQEKTHCPKGHEYDPENTVVDARGWRQCRACQRQHRREYDLRRGARRTLCPRCGAPATGPQRSGPRKQLPDWMCRACRTALRLERRVVAALDGIRDLAEELGRVPSALEFQRLGVASLRQVQNDFGTWKTAVWVAGLDPEFRTQHRYRVNASNRELGQALVPARDGDDLQARSRIRTLILAGRLPHPSTLPCTDCGERWDPNGPRHEYDHYLGYGAAHHEDVEAVCLPCHRQRDAERRRMSA